MLDLNILYDDTSRGFMLTHFNNKKDGFDITWKKGLADVLLFIGDYFTPGATTEEER